MRRPATLERLIGALLLEEHEEWLVARCYISERSMKKLLTPQELLDDQVPGLEICLSRSDLTASWAG